MSFVNRTQNYPKLDGYKFASELVTSGDLDPVYTILYEAKLPEEQLHRWLIAYWMFYHCGVASVLSESKVMFHKALEFIERADIPRGTERRHFRGQNAINSIQYMLQTYGDATEAISFLTDCKHSSKAEDVMARVQRWVGFGPWMSFKVADMLDRVNVVEVVFRPELVFNMFDSPVEGAHMFYEKHGPRGLHNPEIKKEMWVYNALESHLKSYKAPPIYDRPSNIQEIETVLCKYKSACNNSYYIGKDIKEIKHALLKFASSKTSQKLLRVGVNLLW